MESWRHWLDGKLDLRKQKGLYRNLKTDSPAVDFCSNDYLGLARSGSLSSLIHQKLLSTSHHNGATGSRLLTGNTSYNEDIENKLAKLFRAESALMFNSGYTANLAVISALAQKNDTILYDELAHACIKDGARLSLAKRYSFRHNDLNDLEQKLKKADGRKYIAVESVYSMDGDECPLKDLVKLAEKYDAVIILDEAHSTGVAGPLGSGLSVEQDLQDKIGVRVYTFGKGMGIHGACVVGAKALREYLINFARPFIYTTALPAHTLISIECAFDFLQSHIILQEQLKHRIKTFLDNIGNMNNRTLSNSAIQTAIFPGADQAKYIAGKLQEQGLDVRPILSPTVPVNTERIRICLHTFNTEGEILQLTQALKNLNERITEYHTS